MSLFYRLFGCTSVSCTDSRELLNLFLKNGLNFKIKVYDGGACAELPEGVAKRLMTVCNFESVTFKYKPGILPTPKQILRKYGLLAGVAVSVILMILSSLFVWDVRIDGNESVPSGQIIDVLSECGVGVGTYIPSIDSDRVENNVLIKSGRLS